MLLIVKKTYLTSKIIEWIKLRLCKKLYVIVKKTGGLNSDDKILKRLFSDRFGLE